MERQLRTKAMAKSAATTTPATPNFARYDTEVSTLKTSSATRQGTDHSMARPGPVPNGTLPRNSPHAALVFAWRSM